MSENKEANAVGGPTFEGFTVVMLHPGQEAVAEAVAQELGPGWVVRAFGDEGVGFEVTHAEQRRGALSPADAWQKTYRLRARPGVVHAEPIFAAPPPAHDESEVEPGDLDFGSFGWGAELAESEDPDWSLRQMRILEAWEVFAQRHEALPGYGVVVGHPDTGFTRHPEILDCLLIEHGFDFESNDTNAEDPLEGSAWQLRFPGHGTSTSSVIASSPAAQKQYPGDPSGKAVKGLAPGAKIIPLRVSRSVVLWRGSTLNLAHAIEYAADGGAHVISMSMGTGLPNQRLLSAVTYALRRGVIVCAAAGNYVRFVVWPAAYAEVIGVAATNALRSPWRHSSRGKMVDVSAPGESVWCARSELAEGSLRPDVNRGSGTSFAVAAVAGVAALWLSYHGRDQLAARYGVEKIPFIFNQILRASCEPGEGLEAGRYGAGIVNAEKVLKYPLPDGVEHPVPSLSLPGPGQVPLRPEETFEHLFERTLEESAGSLSFEPGVLPPDEKLRSTLAKLLNTTEDGLRARLNEVGAELAFNFATSHELYDQFESALSSGIGDISFDPSETLDEVESVRTGLLFEGVSDALARKLEKRPE